MDTKKIGAFLKQCRKEKNLTQEQLAEKFGVSARTVSRWETGTNLPDLSILVELAEYYDVEMRELLDGERSQTMNKEMKETLDKVAVYEEWAKRKALKAGNLAFASMFMIGVAAIIIQMLLTVDIRFVLGETISVLVGGILYAAIMVYNGIWDKCLPKSATIWRDFLTSVICAEIFSAIYGVCLLRMGATETQITRLALEFLIGITIVAFIILRILAFINQKKNQRPANDQDEKAASLSKMEYIKIYNDSEAKYITKDGQEIKDTDLFTDNKIFAKKQGSYWGFVDKDGKTVVDFKYDKVTEVNKYGFAGIEKSGKWGVINKEGKIILEPKYTLKDNEQPEFIGQYYKFVYGNGEIYYTNN